MKEVSVSNQKQNYAVPLGQELGEVAKMCQLLAEAPYYRKLGPGGVLAIYLTAKELNLPVMSCLNGGLHVIEGKVTLSAQMMNLMIVNAGHFVEIVHSDENYCELMFERSDRPGRNAKYTHKYTIEDARVAGYLGKKDPKSGMMINVKDNWIKNPKDMLFARCISIGGKRWMPDVLMGTYVTGETEVQESEIKEADYQTVVKNFPLTEEKKQCNEVETLVMRDFSEEELAYIQYAMTQAKWDFAKVAEWEYYNPEAFKQKFEAWQQKNATFEHEPKSEEV